MAIAGVKDQETHNRYVALIKSWGGFDRAYYRAANPDVRSPLMGARRHYFKHGFYENRAPNGVVLIEEYRRSFRDTYFGDTPVIVKMIEDDAPELHGRKSFYDAGEIDIEAEVRAWGRFDPAFYLATNPDVRRAGKDPLKHFCEGGLYEGRDPCPEINIRQYIYSHPEINYAACPAFLRLLRQARNV